jgi:hypothetical protein
MRQVFTKVRKMLGRDLTPMKIQARVPRLFWFTVLGGWLLDQKANVPPRLRALVTLRTAVRVGCPFLRRHKIRNDKNRRNRVRRSLRGCGVGFGCFDGFR